ncbi:3-oxoadipate enol-lactonase [Actinoallomurus oryzae]|uniref:3-oxoadipate enol-lactonase n=1 Tax=Actinoallomurus oryzae TaxID=502180 RepID=A0ABP8PZM4_9ACTN
MTVLNHVSAGPDGDTAVVFLHSLGTDHRMWRDQAEALGTRHRVVLPDSRGHGGSAWTGPPAVGDWVADLDGVLDAAGVRRAVLVGLSLGGIQAIAYAAAHPGRVSALVVADSFAALDPEVATAKAEGLAGQALSEGTAALADTYVADTFTVSPLPPGAEVVRSAIAGMDAEAYAATARACFGARVEDRLGAVRAPTLVLWGDRDRKTPRALSERIAAGIEGAELAEVPGAGHLSNLENPAEFTRLVACFADGRS